MSQDNTKQGRVRQDKMRQDNHMIRQDIKFWIHEGDSTEREKETNFHGVV